MDGQGKNYNVNDSLIIDCKCRLQMNKGLSLHGFNTYMLLISSEEKSKGYNVYWYLKPEVCFHQSGKVHKKVFRHKALTSHTFNTSGMKSNSSSQVLKYHRIKKKKTLHQNLSLCAARYLRYAYVHFFGTRCSATITFVCDMLVRP